MRILEPLDVVRCLVVGMNRFPNLAITSAGIRKPQSFYTLLSGISRRRFQPRSRGDALVCVEMGNLQAVAAFRPRSGTRSWEISHLHATPDSGDALIALLERAAAVSAYGGAERVFLRVQADGDTIPMARRAGFFPCYLETLYRRQTSASEPRRGLFDTDSHSVKRRPEHDHALFRLYNETTPVKVRQLVGMTLDQWKDSRERSIGRRIERVVEVDGIVRSWLTTSARSGVGMIDVALHPDYAALAPDVVDFALRSLRNANSVVALVPDYVPLLGGVLEERGFAPEAEFAVLVKSMARMARQPMASRASLVAE
ncbi:MAG: hypothetical protein OXC95_13360 [Dehalococcoidia bacterium]|nr:hypothetical protein [Dehalococcoidia bacterium]